MLTLEMRKASSSAALKLQRGSIAFVGTPIDNRGQAAVDALRPIVGRVVLCEYDALSAQLVVDGTPLHAEDIDTWLTRDAVGDVYLETTTLGFVEVLLLLSGLMATTSAIRMLYVEPLEYTRGPSGQGALCVSKRDFALSGAVSGYRAVPTYAGLLDDRTDHSVLFFLGYEERRLLTAIDEHPISTRNCSVVFGVPAFQPGWEMDAFANNVRVIEQEAISGGVHFCGAENPLAAYHVVQKCYEARSPGATLFVAPIGTKPHGVGVALFASQYKDVRILYDHPIRKQGRTQNIGSWHSYSVLK